MAKVRPFTSRRVCCILNLGNNLTQLHTIVFKCCKREKYPKQTQQRESATGCKRFLRGVRRTCARVPQHGKQAGGTDALTRAQYLCTVRHRYGL